MNYLKSFNYLALVNVNGFKYCQRIEPLKNLSPVTTLASCHTEIHQPNEYKISPNTKTARHPSLPQL